MSATLADVKASLSSYVDPDARVELKVIQCVNSTEYANAIAFFDRLAGLVRELGLHDAELPTGLWLRIEALLSVSRLLKFSTEMGCSTADAFRSVYIGIEALSILVRHETIAEVRTLMRKSLSGLLNPADVADDLASDSETLSAQDEDGGQDPSINA